MTQDEFYNLILSPAYDFLRTDPHLGENIMFLTLGGSHSYGTNVEGSDVDVRGCAMNSAQDILGFSNFEQRVDTVTDTTIYGFNKLVSLLLSCNPNTIELLGNKPDQYFYITPTGLKLPFMHSAAMPTSSCAVCRTPWRMTTTPRMKRNAISSAPVNRSLKTSACSTLIFPVILSACISTGV